MSKRKTIRRKRATKMTRTWTKTRGENRRRRRGDEMEENLK